MRIPFIGVCAAIALTAGCGGTATPGATPSPAATTTAAATVPPTAAATTTPAACPVAAQVCDFARQTLARLARGDVAGVIGAARGSAVTCTTGVNPGLGADFPLCNGATAGEVRYGFDIGRFQSEGGTADRAGLAASVADFLRTVDPARSDALGGGALRLFTVGCPDARVVIDCAGGFSLVYSAILKSGLGSVREFLMLTFTPDAAGTQQIAGLHTGLAQLNMLYLTGGTGAGLRPGDPTSPSMQYRPFAG